MVNSDLNQKILGRQFLHSCYVNKLPDGSDAVIASEYVHYADGRVLPELRIIKKPKRSFYITKPVYRDHDEKKEIEFVEKLDKYTVYNCDLEREIFKVLNGYYPTGYVKLKELCASPYLYGADTPIETLIKAATIKAFTKSKLTPKPATVGFFDIERSMLNGNAAEITVISLTHENKVYTAILNHAFFTLDAHGKRIPGDLDQLKALSQTILTPMVAKAIATNKGLKRHATTTFDFTYYIGNTEFELIQWIFARLHENKTSLVGIWNLDYDIPAILQAIKSANVQAEDLFCAPELPAMLRKTVYVHDDKKVSHPTDKWHWLYDAGYSQFYDAMSLYAKLRTVVGKESSYALDSILKKNGFGGKLQFQDLPDLNNLSKIDWHRRMQSTHPLEYIVYNQWDVLSLQLQEWKNNDAQSMLQLSESTTLAKFTRQTRKISDTLYVDWADKGRILGTVGPSMLGRYDAEIGAVGGAVLDPRKLDYNGLNVLTEAPHHRTQLHAYVNDVDFSGMYPSSAQAGNISKDTKLSTTLFITGDQVQKYYTPRAAVAAFYGHMVNPADNAVALAQEFFGLPNFDEMLGLFEEHRQLTHLLG